MLTKTMTATVMTGGTCNYQSRGAVEETIVVATVTGSGDNCNNGNEGSGDNVGDGHGDGNGNGEGNCDGDGNGDVSGDGNGNIR